MDNIQSNSQESLLKDKISSKTTSATCELVFNKINDAVKTYSLDKEKVCKTLLDAIDCTEVRSWLAFVSAILNNITTKELDKYKKDWKTPNFLALHLAFDEEGFVGELWEKLLIDAVETHALNEFPIKVQDLIDTNHAIIKYCKEKTYKEFLDYLLRSKLFKKVNTPLENLTLEAKRQAEELEEDLAYLGTI